MPPARFAWNIFTLLLIAVSLYGYNRYGRALKSDEQMSFERWVKHAEDEFYARAVNRPLLQTATIHLRSDLDNLKGEWTVVAENATTPKNKRSRARFQRLLRVLQLIRDSHLFESLPLIETDVQPTRGITLTVAQGKRKLYQSVIPESVVESDVKLQNLLQLVLVYGEDLDPSSSSGVAYASTAPQAKELTNPDGS